LDEHIVIHHGLVLHERRWPGLGAASFLETGLGTESKELSALHLPVSFLRINVHSAHRVYVFQFVWALSTMSAVSMVRSVSPVHHMGSTTEAHHEKEQTCEDQ
jgi:hypothetical protein